MKKILSSLFFQGVLGIGLVQAQCGAGTTSAAINWDNLEYFYNSGAGAAPYGFTGGTYVTDAQESVQQFGLGANGVTISLNAPFANGENTAHTGDLGIFTGSDVNFFPTANNQTITLNFTKPVSNLSFALYDLDRSASYTIAATNNSLPVNVSVTRATTNILTLVGNNTALATLTANNTNAANNVNDGTVSVSVSGLVTRLVITVVNRGSDENFWLSDIHACVPDAYPTLYHQTAYSQPFAGQSAYVITTPDNNSAYMLNPQTGVARHLFTDATNTFINSFAYDDVNKRLYYVSESNGADVSNKTLKRYNFNTNSIETIGDLELLLGIPFFDGGIQTGGAAFYNGCLFLGVEGGRYSNTNTRESVIWRIEFNSSLVPVAAFQVFGTPASNNITQQMIHDWGDFIIKDGILYNFNTARNGSGATATYPNSSFIHYNLTTSAVNVYPNPGTSAYTGQAGMDWNGNIYVIRDAIGLYNQNGTVGTMVPITAAAGSPAWVGSSGDATEGFRPRMDFGDAPMAYEPDALRPAVHEVDERLRLGASTDIEWIKSSSSNAYINADADGMDEDGIASLNNITRANTYLARVRVFNTTGAPATLIGWIDLDKDNIFEPSEATSFTVPSMGAEQNIDLFWPSITNTLPNLTTTYLRLRLTSQSNGMTTAGATGYFSNGEVEDYLINVDKTLLADNGVQLDAVRLGATAVQLKWQANGGEWARFVVQRSVDGSIWHNLGFISSQDPLPVGKQAYQFIDSSANGSILYYRVQLQPVIGTAAYTDTKKLLSNIDNRFKVVPNPVMHNAAMQVDCKVGGPLQWWVYQQNGQLVLQGYQQSGKGANLVPITGVEKLPAGTYVVVVQDAVSSRHSLFVKR